MTNPFFYIAAKCAAQVIEGSAKQYDPLELDKFSTEQLLNEIERRKSIPPTSACSSITTLL